MTSTKDVLRHLLSPFRRQKPSEQSEDTYQPPPLPEVAECYKLTHLDGVDYYKKETINYRGDGIYPHTVKVPSPAAVPELYKEGVLHATVNPDDCSFRVMPFSVFRVRGKPVCGGLHEYGFYELEVLEEIPEEEFSNLFSWPYSKVARYVHPFKLPKRKPTRKDIRLLAEWVEDERIAAEVVRFDIGRLPREMHLAPYFFLIATVGDSVEKSVDKVMFGERGETEFFPTCEEAREVERVVRGFVDCYIGHFFLPSNKSKYQFQCVVDLWERGLVPSYDGTSWRLHSGPTAEIVWEERLLFSRR